MLFVAQLSDPHITEHLGLVPIDPAERLRAVVDEINSRSTPVDLVLVTGDLTDDGTVEQYATLTDILRGLTARVMVLPGNHDRDGQMRESLAQFLPNDLADDHLGYVIDDLELRIVCIDTTHPDRHDGVISEASQAWLEATLTESDRPTMVFMHHPAIKSGIIWMDAMALSNADAFHNTITKYPHVVAVSAGHLHRSFSGRIAHAAATVAPSTSHQLNLNFTADKAGLVLEPSAYLIHYWNDDALVTHTVPVGDYEVISADEWAAQSKRLDEAGEGFPKF